MEYFDKYFQLDCNNRIDYAYVLGCIKNKAYVAQSQIGKFSGYDSSSQIMVYGKASGQLTGFNAINLILVIGTNADAVHYLPDADNNISAYERMIAPGIKKIILYTKSSIDR